MRLLAPGERAQIRVRATVRRTPPQVSVAWLIGIARHKLVDHWRRMEREQKGLAAAGQQQTATEDPWGEVLDAQTAHVALLRLPPPQRLALTLRYLDGLSVPEVAVHLERSVHATETFERAFARSETTVAALLGLSWVMREPGSGTRSEFEAALQKRRLVDRRRHYRACRALHRHGDGGVDGVYDSMGIRRVGMAHP